MSQYMELLENVRRAGKEDKLRLLSEAAGSRAFNNLMRLLFDQSLEVLYSVEEMEALKGKVKVGDGSASLDFVLNRLVHSLYAFRDAEKRDNFLLNIFSMLSRREQDFLGDILTRNFDIGLSCVDVKDIIPGMECGEENISGEEEKVSEEVKLEETSKEESKIEEKPKKSKRGRPKKKRG